MPRRHNHADISNYTPMSQGGMERAVEAVQYYSHRPDESGRVQFRSGFDSDRDHLAKSEMLDGLSKARDQGARYVYSVVLSPDHRAASRDLKEYTREVVDGTLRERHGEGLAWKAIVHDNQNGHPHVHVVLMTRVTLNRTEFRQFNRQVDDSWRGGDQQRHEQEHQQEWSHEGWVL